MTDGNNWKTIPGECGVEKRETTSINLQNSKKLKRHMYSSLSNVFVGVLCALMFGTTSSSGASILQFCLLAPLNLLPCVHYWSVAVTSSNHCLKASLSVSGRAFTFLKIM